MPTHEPHTWPTVAEVLGREPSAFEEALCWHLIRSGKEWVVREILYGNRDRTTSVIGSLAHAGEYTVECWAELEPTHQEHIRLELEVLLWQLEGRTPQGSWTEGASAVSRDREFDLSALLRLLQQARSRWSLFKEEERTLVREAVQALRKVARQAERVQK